MTALVLGAQPSAGNHREQVILADGFDPNWNNSASRAPEPDR